METFEERLKRYTDRDALDTFGWMTMLIHNHHIIELRRAREGQLYQCVYLMAHAVMQTVSENMFGHTGVDATKFFVKAFVDHDGANWSPISEVLHDVRNLIAHQAYSRLQHSVEYFAVELDRDWQDVNGTVLINPVRFALQIEDVFTHSTVYNAFKSQSYKERSLRKYQFIRKWLKLTKTDPITKAILKLESINIEPDIITQEALISKAIYAQYRL